MLNAHEVFDVVDLHAAGEPLRLVRAGYPPLPGATVLERRAYLRDHLDHYRRRLLFEPWGHRDMYGCLLVPPERPDSLAGLIFMTNEGYSTMCGHATIAVATFLVESGWVAVEAGQEKVDFHLDAPCGQLAVSVALTPGGAVDHVSFENVPAFSVALDVPLEVAGRPVTVDLTYGGAFYAVVPAAAFGLEVSRDDLPALVERAAQIKAALGGEGATAADGTEAGTADPARSAAAATPAARLRHPDEPRLAGLYGTIFTGPAGDPAHHSRNVTVFADGQVDRSPCGSCLSSRLALLAARDRLQPGDAITVESIIDSTFAGRLLGPAAPVGEHQAWRTEISGRAYTVGFRRFYRDPADTVAPFVTT